MSEQNQFVIGMDCGTTNIKAVVLRSDGKVDLYSGIGDTAEGRVVIDNPFQGLLTGAPDR